MGVIGLLLDVETLIDGELLVLSLPYGGLGQGGYHLVWTEGQRYDELSSL